MKQSSIGGQAVIEGVMVKSPRRVCMAVRRPDGGIELVEQETIPYSKRHKWAALPIIRGFVNLVEQLGIGYKMLMKSADIAFPEEAQEEGTAGMGILGVLSTALAVILALGLFFVLPSLIAGWILPEGGVWFNLLEGGIRMAIFVVYLGGVSIMKDMRRVYMYHGAEHKVLHCYEHDLLPTAENAKKFSRVHPRCGTSFLFLVMVVSIVVFSCLGIGSNIWIRVLSRIVLIPLVAGLSYEVLKLVAKRDGILAKIIRAPGLWLQRLSTREPSDDMVEVAAAALNAAKEDEFI